MARWLLTAVGYNMQTYTIMKRYLYILLSTTLTLLGCEHFTSTDKPEVAFCFTPIEVRATETTATIQNRSYMTIDGIRSDEKTTFYLEYAKINEEEFVRGGDFLRLSDGWFEFSLTDLEPGTAYKGRITIDGGEYGSETGEPFPFTTKEDVKIESISCNAEVDAKGLFATVHLSDVAYLVNEEPQQIAFIKVEYARQNESGWNYIEATGSSIKNGKIEFTIPQSGEEYLVENRSYNYRVTITPSNSDYKAITTDNFSFKTEYAEVSAEFSTPILSYGDEGISARVNSVEVYFDGISAEEYDSSYPIEYSFRYRKKGANNWDKVEAEVLNGGIQANIPASKLIKGATYEVTASITAGAQKQMCETSISYITIPTDETPDTPEVPEPPTGGDTSAIKGVWHLAEWRGTTPPFEVYLDITATGGITLYQRMENNYWEVFQSSAYINGGVISGVYTDYTSWGASYAITIDNDSMTWVDTADSEDISRYTRSELPTHMPTAPTRATFSEDRFL